MAIKNADATVSNVSSVQVADEHGAGAVGTSSFGAPQTYRRIHNGIIITQIKFDITGLTSGTAANDVSGLTGITNASIGRNVVAKNGIIFKTLFTCLETPLTGDNDTNIVTSSSVLDADGAGGTTYIANGGDLLIGQSVQNLVPALTANDYYYLTGGAGDADFAYTAGQYILTLWGHQLLV